MVRSISLVFLWLLGFLPKVLPTQIIEDFSGHE